MNEVIIKTVKSIYAIISSLFLISHYRNKINPSVLEFPIECIPICARIILYCFTIFIFCDFLAFQSIFASQCIYYDVETQTIVLLCGEGKLIDISDNLGPNNVLQQETNRVWVLTANIVVGNSATLNINSTYTSWLKINSTNNHDPYHIDVLGNINIDSVKISSWNFHSQNYTRSDGSMPRPYISVLTPATGKVVIRDADLSFLGYRSPSREGLSFNGGRVILENNKIHDQYYGIIYSIRDFVSQNNTLYNNIYNIGNMTHIDSNRQISMANLADNSRPFVSIRSPKMNSTISSKYVTVLGTAFDEQSGVQKVEVFEHTFPFNNTFPYKLANQVKNGSWSDWKYHFNLAKSGVHRVSARVTDGAGNQNWAEIRFQIASQDDTRSNGTSQKRLAVVNPLFTDGAYNVGGFYEFYPKYDDIPEGLDVYTDLDLLTSQIPDYDIESKKASDLLLDHLHKLTNGTISNISDEDVHEGYIFNDDGSNAYDVLFLSMTNMLLRTRMVILNALSVMEVP